MGAVGGGGSKFIEGNNAVGGIFSLGMGVSTGGRRGHVLPDIGES